MPAWRRSHGVPAQVCTGLALAPGERVLAGAIGREGASGGVRAWRRSQGVPAQVCTGRALAPGERVLAGAIDREGAWVVGTDRALHLPTGDRSQALAWEQVR